MLLFLSVCSVVLIKSLEIKSVCSSALSSEELPETNTRVVNTPRPCNWLPSALYWIVFKQMETKTGAERGQQQKSPRSDGRLSSHRRDRVCFSLSVKDSLIDSWHALSWKAERSVKIGTLVLQVRKIKHNAHQGFAKAVCFPSCFWKHSLFWEEWLADPSLATLVHLLPAPTWGRWTGTFRQPVTYCFSMLSAHEIIGFHMRSWWRILKMPMSAEGRGRRESEEQTHYD